MSRETTSYAKLKVSRGAYIEIREKLIDAGYVHLFTDLGGRGEVMKLVGIALVPEKGCGMPSHHWDCTCEGMGGDR